MDLCDLMCEAVKGGLTYLNMAQMRLRSCPGIKGIRTKCFTIAKNSMWGELICVKWPGRDCTGKSVYWGFLSVNGVSVPIDGDYTPIQIVMDVLDGDPDKVLFAVKQLYRAAWWCKCRDRALRGAKNGKGCK